MLLLTKHSGLRTPAYDKHCRHPGAAQGRGRAGYNVALSGAAPRPRAGGHVRAEQLGHHPGPRSAA